MIKPLCRNIILILIFLFACKPNKGISKLIIDWELNYNKTQVIEVLKIGTLRPITKQDSALILEQEYQNQKKEKFEALNVQLNEIEERISKTKSKLDSTDNVWMKRAINNRLDELDYKKKQCLEIINVYSDSTFENSLNILQSKIDYYLNDPQQVIAYQIETELVMQQGLLTIDTVNYTYVLNLMKYKVLDYYDN